jgi:hypothetical protein
MADKKSKAEGTSQHLENISQSVIITGSKVEGSVSNQITHIHDVAGKIDLKQLAEELALLKAALKDKAQDTEHFVEMAEVAQAEKAAKANDRQGLLQHLKNVSAWTLDVATKIAVPLAVEALKLATGLK